MLLRWPTPGDLLPHHRRDRRAQEFYGPHDLLVLDGPHAELEQQPLVAEISCWKRIFSMIAAGSPTKSDPRSLLDSSICCRVMGAQPRSRPILFITTSAAG